MFVEQCLTLENWTDLAVVTLCNFSVSLLIFLSVLAYTANWSCTTDDE